jgi:aminomethyltransferase
VEVTTISTQQLKHTPLYNEHLRAGAKMIAFGDWEMPVQYKGILEEHRAVRNAVGLFDVSHMGEIAISGSQALATVQHLITNDASEMVSGQIIYSPMCYPHGGVVDDLLVYKRGEDNYLMVVNASNTAKDLEWMQENACLETQVTNLSEAIAQLALQGPKALPVLQSITDVKLTELAYYHFTIGKVAGIECIISRTGYTGELGFELYCPPEQAKSLWDALLTAGQGEGIMPIGLGARDTLRFEAGMPLYGHELSEHINPLEAGLGKFVKLDKDEFIGKHALVQAKALGIKRKLVGLAMVERGIPRGGYLLTKDGKQMGTVTSGTFAPSLGKNVGLGLVPAELAKAGTELEVIIRDKAIKAVVVSTPFYKKDLKGGI